ncbi:hypothetical protein E4U61_002337 [Claviceps capensis]|nr:hypothetical protein E4U61_002337 [Claviceps capensis]
MRLRRRHQNHGAKPVVPPEVPASDLFCKSWLPCPARLQHRFRNQNYKTKRPSLRSMLPPLPVHWVGFISMGLSPAKPPCLTRFGILEPWDASQPALEVRENGKSFNNADH